MTRYILTILIVLYNFCVNAQQSITDSLAIYSAPGMNDSTFSEIETGPDDTLKKADNLSKLSDKFNKLSPTADLRSVDGLFLGLSYKINKVPGGNLQKISVLKSIRTKALTLQYEAIWPSVVKNTDLIINGLADMKGNILNFFGLGNDTFFDQTGEFRVYYRVNFSFYQFEPAFRINLSNTTSITTGPSFQYFTFNATDNDGRFINTPAVKNQYMGLEQDKAHGGLQLTFNWDKRDDKKLPTRGINLSIRMHGFDGLNSLSDAYAQAFPQISFYQSLNSKGNIILANRTGAGYTIGKTAFYQSAFLGSQDNLLGFRKFRFAGDNLIYNNLEVRIGLHNFLHKILSGKIGVIGFYDAGRVWIENDTSKTIHHGYGGGIYLTPFNRFFIRAVAGFSNEGMQPTVALRQRF